ncbi:MAG: type 1 glutamine amidotransferase [Chitinophagales bacterium]|nr:type 1 glutamine amidotransferase [Chitinophagales bacterium]
MSDKLNNKKVAVLVTDGFEESEFSKPVEALKDAGATVEVISLKSGKVKSWSGKDWSEEYDVDKTIDEVQASEYDALVLPGGVMNPDALRMNVSAVQFASEFMATGKPVAAICHGPWTLVETGKLKGKKVTSWPSLKTDITNAGAQWVDEEVVVDQGLVTSRKPEDLKAFCKKMIEEIAEGKHPRN